MAQKICQFCKSEIPEGARFCPKCGKEIVPLTCPACGTEVREGARFCHKCGKEIISSLPLPPKSATPSTPPWQKSAMSVAAPTKAASTKKPSAPVKKKSHAGLVVFLIIFIGIMAVIIIYSIANSNHTDNVQTPVVTPGVKTTLTVEENDALWAKVNTALTRFVGDNLPLFATFGTNPVTQQQIDHVAQQVIDFDKALGALESVNPPPEEEIVNNTLLPLYRGIFGAMVAVRDALGTGDPFKLDLEVQRLGVLLDELSGASGIMAPESPSENVTTSAPAPVVVIPAPTPVSVPKSVLPLPTGTPPKPASLIASDAEYYLMYAAYKNWGYDFASDFAKYSQNAISNKWTSWWMGNTSNEQQRLNFTLVGDKWSPDSMPPLPPNIPPKPANLLAGDSWYFLMYTVYNTSWGFNFNSSFAEYSQQAIDKNWTNFWMGDASNASKRLNFHLVGDKWALD